MLSKTHYCPWKFGTKYLRKINQERIFSDEYPSDFYILAMYNN